GGWRDHGGLLRAAWVLAEEAGDEGVEARDFVLQEVEEPEGGALRVGADDEGDDVHRGAAVRRCEAELHGLTRAHAPAHAGAHPRRRELGTGAVADLAAAVDPDRQLDGRARGQRIFRAAHDERLIAELADEVAEDLGQPLVVLDDQDPHRGPRPSTAPQKIGSGVSPTPKRSRTTSCTWRANARTSPARAPSWA